MTKVYPGFLLPLAVFAGPRSTRRVLVAFVVAAGATMAIVVALTGGDPSEIYQDAFSSRLGAGVHLETTWGSMLLIAERFGLATPIEFYLSTYYFQGGGLVAFLEPLALALTLVSVILGTLVTANCEKKDRDLTFAYAMFATVALLLAFSTTFSPQFVIWLAAPAAAVASIRNSILGWIPWLTIPIVAMTQYLYPYQYQRILDRDWLGLSVLAGRNLLILLTGVLAFAAIVRSQGSEAGILHAWTAARERLSRLGEANRVRAG